MEVKELQSRIEGKVTIVTDAGYDNLRREIIWNQLTPTRYPQLIVQVATEHDVVEAVNVVTADGSLVVANQEEHTDLLWAIRGAGPGFLAVVTQYLLKLYPVPRAVTSSTYYYPLQRIEEVGAWAASIARQLPREVELTIFCAPAPPTFAERCRSSNGFVSILSATAVVDSRRKAAATLGLLESCPVSPECLEQVHAERSARSGRMRLGKSGPEPTRFSSSVRACRAAETAPRRGARSARPV